MKSYNDYNAWSIQGRRDNNEDLCHLESLSNEKYLFAVVCDGVGGEAAGEVASYIAVKQLVEYLKSFNDISLDTLRSGFISANNDIIKQQSNPRQAHMCTCVSACVVSPETNELHICHVGDTRIYAYNKENAEITKLTRDHSFVGRLYDEGLIKEHEAISHPKRNRIDRCLGSRQLSWFDDYIYAVTVSPDKADRLLLCSDGLYDVVCSDEMKSILVMDASPEITAKVLVDKAFDNGSHDNISVIIIDK